MTKATNVQLSFINGRSIAYGSRDGSYGNSTHLYTIPIAKNCYYSMNVIKIE